MKIPNILMREVSRSFCYEWEIFYAPTKVWLAGGMCAGFMTIEETKNAIDEVKIDMAKYGTRTRNFHIYEILKTYEDLYQKLHRRPQSNVGRNIHTTCRSPQRRN